MSAAEHHVAVLGATPKAGRFAHQAVIRLKQHGYKITPVHPKFAEIEDLPVSSSLTQINEQVDTLTLYVGPDKLAGMVNEIVNLKPGRVIFNPGTESRELQSALDDAGIQWQEDCTLVMLQAGKF